jgi:hypothetical protein
MYGILADLPNLILLFAILFTITPHIVQDTDYSKEYSEVSE